MTIIQDALEYIVKGSRKITLLNGSEGTDAWLNYEGEYRSDSLVASHQDGPLRAEGFRQFHALEDLGNFVEETAVSPRGYFNGTTLNVVLNDDMAGKPGWRSDHAQFNFRRSVQFNLFAHSIGDYYSQSDFVDLIERITPFIVNPDPAVMLEVVSSLQASRSARIENAVRTSDGNVRMQWLEDTTGSAGATGDLEIPQKVTVQVPLFVGTQPTNLDLSFRWKLNRHDGTMTMGLFMPVLPVVEESVKSDVVDAFIADVNFPVVFGEGPDGASVI